VTLAVVLACAAKVVVIVALAVLAWRNSR